uniref:C3H1-type domain-containing protein n=1 Tax=Globodera rostochiensis TaxID=31243 RepID=A0A914IEM4_GLORO
MEYFSPTMKMDVFKFENFQIGDELASHLSSWDPFESHPFSLNILNENIEEEPKLSKRFSICERKHSECAKSTDELWKMANSFKGQNMLDFFDMSRSEDTAQKPAFKSLAERRLKFQHDLRWSFDVEDNKKLSREDRVVGRKPQTATSTPTKHSSPEHQHRTFIAQNSPATVQSAKIACVAVSKNEMQTKNVPSSAIRCRAKSIRKRQFVNGIHLKFIKPASQCPDWDKPGHRDQKPGCTMWHPKAPCYFYPNCRLTAELCGFAHPFCGNYGCKCGNGAQSPQLNHLPAQLTTNVTKRKAFKC